MGLSFDFLRPADKERTGAALFLFLLREHLWTLVRANLCFLLCSLPVFTIPTAWTALTHVAMQLVRQQPIWFRDDFFRVFRQNLFRSIPIGLCSWTAPVLAFFAIPFYRSLLSQSAVIYLPLAVIFCVSLVSILFGYYAFAMLCSVELSNGQIVKNAFLLTLVRLPKSMLCFVLCAALTLLVILTLPLSLLALVGIFFSLLAMFQTWFAWDAIASYVLNKD